MYDLLFILVGLGVGIYATLIGAGGGFILMPLLILLYPDQNPEFLTSISLVVVFFNALSGSIAYFRMKRIDFKSGLLFAPATIPGAIIGALATSYFPRQVFDAVFGTLLTFASIFLIIRPLKDQPNNFKNSSFSVSRTILEANGKKHSYSFNPFIGIGLSFLVGFFSSLMGIGGGIIHVPILVYLLNFPVHIATATSQFILLIIAFVGTLTHIAAGTFVHDITQIIFVSLGVIFGAQLGAKISNRIHANWIIRILALTLGFVGLRILFGAL